MVRADMTRWTAELVGHRPEPGDLPDDVWTPLHRVLTLVDRIASGSLDDLSGRFLHATDEPETLRAGVASTGPRARTLRLVAAGEDDPLAR
jgi:hypothetical protein